MAYERTCVAEDDDVGITFDASHSKQFVAFLTALSLGNCPIRHEKYERARRGGRLTRLEIKVLASARNQR